MKGILKLSETLLCEKEVLGEIYDFEIEDIKGHLHFPQYPIINQSNSDYPLMPGLLPPAIISIRNPDKLTHSWGNPALVPPGISYVKALALTIDCTEEHSVSNAKILYKSIQKWEQAFTDYIKIVRKQNVKRDLNVNVNTCMLYLYNKTFIPDSPIFYIDGDVHSKTAASKSEIKDAIDFANSGKELALEYQMLVSAYKAIMNNQNRLAILDACSSIEIALIKQITSFCQSKEINPSILINQYRSLNDRFKLLKEISTKLPKLKYLDEIVKPRNEVMHNRDVNPTNETTEKLILCVENYLKFFNAPYYY
ncbi:MAG: hypothetical protein IKG15_10355 [Solobacterium sp.]|nr:hypothetical protein [Solobacterium sp.]